MNSIFKQFHCKSITYAFCVFVFVIIFSEITFGQVSEEDAEQVIYSQFRTVIFDTLKAKLKRQNFKIPVGDVIHSALAVLDTLGGELRRAKWIKSNKYEGKVTNVESELNEMIRGNAENPLKYETDGSFSSVEETVNAYLVELFQESATLGRAGTLGTNPLSDYRFLMGGSWVHTDSAAAKGTFTASLFVRTRLYDSRGKISENNVDASWFLDLLVDAQFITNEPFNLTDSVNPDSVRKVILESVQSSKLKMGLYFASPPFLADYGVIGIFGNFEISTRERSSDIFRRVIWGIRLENRSVYRLNGASAQVGFTVNKTAGSLEPDKGRIFGVNRVVLDFELPLTDKSTRLGLYAQFHGEWPIGDIGDNERIKLEKTGELKDISPPVYQFRLGATFDPMTIFGPIFGISN